MRMLLAALALALVAGDADAGPFAARRAARSGAGSCGSASVGAGSCGSAGAVGACGQAAAVGACGAAAVSACGSGVTVTAVPAAPPQTIVVAGYTYQLVPVPAAK